MPYQNDREFARAASIAIINCNDYLRKVFKLHFAQSGYPRRDFEEMCDMLRERIEAPAEMKRAQLRVTELESQVATLKSKVANTEAQYARLRNDQKNLEASSDDFARSKEREIRMLTAKIVDLQKTIALTLAEAPAKAPRKKGLFSLVFRRIEPSQEMRQR